MQVINSNTSDYSWLTISFLNSTCKSCISFLDTFKKKDFLLHKAAECWISDLSKEHLVRGDGKLKVNFLASDRVVPSLDIIILFLLRLAFFPDNQKSKWFAVAFLKSWDYGFGNNLNQTKLQTEFKKWNTFCSIHFCHILLWLLSPVGCAGFVLLWLPEQG